MPRVSRKPVNKNLYRDLNLNFISLISSLQNSDDIEGFFNSFLTREEKLMLSKRLMLHLLLEKGYKTVQIESLLSISRETIRIHKLIWENGSPEYIKILRKILSQNDMKNLFKKLELLIKPFETAVKAQSNMKARAKLGKGDFS